MHLRTLIASLVLLTACAGAQSGPPPDAPRAEATALRTLEQTLSSYTVQVEGTVTNPREAPLTVTEARYALSAMDAPVREGRLPLELTVPPGGSAQVRVPVAVEYAPTRELLEETGESMRVVFDGSLLASYGDETVELELVRAGEVRTPRMPKVALGSPTASRQRVDAIAASFALRIANENPFPVRLGRLDYVLTVEGNELSAGTLGHRATVPPSSEVLYEIATELTEQTVPGLQGFLKEKNALDYTVRGALWIGDLQIPVSLDSQIRFTSER